MRSLHARNGLDLDGPVDVEGSLSAKKIIARSLRARSLRVFPQQGLNPSRVATKRLVDQVASSVVPRGAICLWYGARDEVPDGWRVCDGGVLEGATEGLEADFFPSGSRLPDFTGRFAEGASANKGVRDDQDQLGNPTDPPGRPEGHTTRLPSNPRHTHDMALFASGPASADVSVLVPSLRASQVGTFKISTGETIQPGIVVAQGGPATDQKYGGMHRHGGIGFAGLETPAPFAVEPPNRKLYYIVKT
jgi:hypothetical protein